MRQGVGEVEKERLVGFTLLFNPTQTFVRKTVVNIGFAFRWIVRVVFLLFVSPNEVRVEAMGAGLVEVTEEEIESLLGGNTGGACFTEAPFADASRGVTGFLENFCNGDVLWFQMGACVSSDARAPRMLAGHQAGSGRRTNGAARVVIEKLHPFRRQLINAWRLHNLLAVAPEVIDAEIVSKDVNDVGLVSGGGSERQSKRSEQCFHGAIVSGQ